MCFFVCSFSHVLYGVTQEESDNLDHCVAEIVRMPIEFVLNIPQVKFTALVKSKCDKEKKYKILGRYEPTQKDIAKVLAAAGYETTAHCVAHAITTMTLNEKMNTNEACFEAKDALVVTLRLANNVTSAAYYRALCSEAHRNEGIIADFCQVWLPRNGKAAKWSDEKVKWIAHAIGALVVMRPYNFVVSNALKLAGQNTTIEFKGKLGEKGPLMAIIIAVFS